MEVKKKKYSSGFNRDFNWYLSMRNTFSFDGRLPRELLYDKDGVDGKMAFHIFDSQGKIVPTKHINILKSLLLTKGSTNLHIKMFAEDRAAGLLPGIEFRAMCIKWKVPLWVKEAVERQKHKYYSRYIAV